jgi:hypothetical protein
MPGLQAKAVLFRQMMNNAVLAWHNEIGFASELISCAYKSAF